MVTRADIETEVSARVMIAANSTLFPSTRLTQVVKDANLWAGTMFFWPSLYKSMIFSSAPNTQNLAYDYYDYPTNMLTGSISRLYIGGLKYDKKAFQDFLDYVDNAMQNTLPPDPTKKYFAEFGRQFFVYPTVTTTGIDDGLVWGNVQPDDLSNSTSNTIFSLWDDSGNEAICKKALSVLTERIDGGFSNIQKQEAVQLLSLIWKKVTTELQKSQRLNHPFFNVIDLFGAQSGQSNIGNFNSVDVTF